MLMTITILIIIIIIMCKLQSSSSMKNHDLVSEESELCFFPVEPLQLLLSSALSCPHCH
jgi:hypothetical protein